MEVENLGRTHVFEMFYIISILLLHAFQSEQSSWCWKEHVRHVSDAKFEALSTVQTTLFHISHSSLETT